jgi:O-antigen/teichoic acid export membrane protein
VDTRVSEYMSEVATEQAEIAAAAARSNGLEAPTKDLAHKSVVGGFAAVSGQALKFVIQTGTTMALARLLSPQDFGLQGMVVAVTGFLGLFRDAGLGAATIQRFEVTHEQTSTLFWVNVAVGLVLAGLCAVLAPAIASFYHEPRLYWIAMVSSVGFLCSGLAAQHQALLLRGMRFVTAAKIDVLAMAGGSVAGVAMALGGCRYWSLVGMALVSSLVSAVGVWLVVRWRPGPPRRRAGVRSMLHFGWKATCNNFVVFLAMNAEKILLGRFWGAEVLGVYGRAYQLVTLPVQQLNTAVSGVAFPALSRIQHERERLARSFLRGFSLLISMTIPITVCCALFAEGMVRVVLGAKWMDAVPIFRLLAPTAVVFALANPLSWLVISTGRAGRALAISATTTPVVLLGIALGLSHGAKGVALGYSLTMTLMVIPIAAWSKSGTAVTWAGLWEAAKRPAISGLAAAAIGLAVRFGLGTVLPAVPLMAIGVAVVMSVYAWVLLIALGQKSTYMDLITQLVRRPGAADATVTR